MLLTVPIKPNDLGFKELIQALENCPSIQDPQKRKNVIGFLDDIGKQVEERNTVHESVLSILKAFSGYPDRFDELINAIDFYEQNNSYFQNLFQVVSALARQQQEARNNSKEEIALFDVKLQNSERDETFESLWSELCSILKIIDWKNICKACYKIKEINKNCEDSVYIKSLCFTNNYELLKQVFLDQYEPTLLIIKLDQLLKDDNGQIKSWLDKANHKLKKTEAAPDHNINENSSGLPPILLIIIERLGDGQNQDKWNVQGQFKIQGKLFEISLSKNKNGIDCPKFENIPTAIKSYIDYLETDTQFRGQAIDQLRIEVFIPLSDLHSSLDNWAMISEEEEATISLVKNYRLFLRSRERIRKNSRIGSLKKGWERIHTFLNGDCREISKNILVNNINNTPASNIIELLEDTQISNWKELEIFMRNCSSLWGIRLKGSLSIDRFERMRFFESIFDSGIPLAVWNWDSIPSGVEFEQKFTECLNWDNLSNRCHGLLEKTWELRSVVWGARTETERKQYPGYYFGMLLEDPEILPDEKPLQIIGGN
ncbi:MAG: hypothetical protein EWV53_05845 [Microcystis panniformis Mp_MB_F_20051200_S9]|uniref:Uncharacterized protein n=1 Tax=Microcystis panniformis Mp_MB_F_20051200_S9 TaxID=2486223 RepID=A0A552Q6E3_9CHRO|nr:MAG: hypothetical protein EWV43_17635 [Microcystis panniformis Mp_MB_F_20080800_S26D]TRV51098.1 MAG: hypothetical protein EWV87_07245 [Microcystis panniformis Mp_GB_SS_20050300_S99]TRV56051.1 MAG: hypothetical protein EWV42_00220 [Microcystis panniformis Mp_GB_SS_20050300_S99D]TRV56801.1 MAG: hypothetical protein EWV69_17230 [Microcystis panniformis Mp_MB_F_20080800_S26]TRV64729.1 MAG: hypothetical protein EWV53_05845 [Microcystis panniformis Mp_MB_F_20051200_S9]TRV68279.1 MAG: hypothetical